MACKRLLNSGRHTFKIHVVKKTSNVWIGFMWSGDVPDKNKQKGSEQIGYTGNCKTSYAYVSGSGFYHKGSSSAGERGDARYEGYSTGDKITSTIDFDARTIGFKKNEKELGVAWKNI